MEAAPMHVASNFSFMGLILFVGIGLAILFMLAMILRTLTGRSHRVHHAGEAGSPDSPSRSILSSVLLGLGLLVAGVFLFGFLTLVPYRMVQKEATLTASYESDRGRLMETSTEVANANATNEASAETGNDPSQLPPWTKQEQIVLANGQVPSVLFVETSGLYSSQEEAMAEAMKNAISKFKLRLAETWSQLASQPVPENIFRNVSIQQVYTETRMHSFGAYEEPMYRVYLQYLDSAETREPVIEAWKNTFSGNRALQFGLGFGALAALLGVISAGLRALSAAKGSRGRAVMTALAFAGLGLVGLLFIA